MAEPKRTFLGVDRSVSGRRWVHALDPRAEAAAARMAQLTGLPDIVGRVMPRAASRRRRPTLSSPPRSATSCPIRRPDRHGRRRRAAADAIDRRETVAVFGDYERRRGGLGGAGPPVLRAFRPSLRHPHSGPHHGGLRAQPRRAPRARGTWRFADRHRGLRLDERGGLGRRSGAQDRRRRARPSSGGGRPSAGGRHRQPEPPGRPVRSGPSLCGGGRLSHLVPCRASCADEGDRRRTCPTS